VRSRAAEPNNKAWAAILACAAVAAAALACVAVVAVGAGKANAAPTPTRATIEATQFTVPERQTGEEFAVCKGNKRAVGGGVVQSGEAAVGMTVIASGPLDASGVTLQTKDGDIAKQWYAAVSNDTAQQRTYRVFAICSSTSKATIEATQLSVPGGQVEARSSQYAPEPRGLLAEGRYRAARATPPSLWARMVPWTRAG
jgi:hypothetical protein